MTAEARTESSFPLLGELKETMINLETDIEGREAVAGGILMELESLRGGELTQQDRELVAVLADEPILSIKFLRKLRESRQDNAAA